MANGGRFRERYITAIVRWRFAVIALWAAFVGASSIVYLSQFRIDNSVGIWFLEDDPELEDYRQYNTDFGEREWTYIWLRGDSVFSPEFLRDLKLVRDRIESLENVTRVMALTDAGGIRRGLGGEPDFESYYPSWADELRKHEAEEFRGKVRSDTRFEGTLVPKKDDRFTIIALQNANRIDAIEPYRIRMIDEIREAVSSFPAILDFGIVGTTVVNAELNRAARHDMFVYYTMIAAFVLVGGRLALGRARDLLVLCAVVLGTIFPVMGGIAAFGLPFNLMTIMLPTLLVTVSVSYLIHFISEFHAVRSAQDGKADAATAISATFGRLLRPGFWTSVTTAIGFASLTVSPVAPIRHIGFFAAAGIGLAWLNTITIAPALLSLLWQKGDLQQSDASTSKDGMSRILGWLARPRPIFAALLGAAILAGVLGLIRLEADTDYVKFFRPGSDVGKEYAQLDQLGMPSSYLTVTVRFPDGVRIANLERHEAMRRFENSILTLPRVIEIRSIDRVVEQAAADLGDGDRLTVPLLTIAKFGGLGGSDEFVADDGRLLQLRVMTGPMSTKDINAFRAGLALLANEQPAGWEIAVTGTNVLWANMDAHVVRTQLLSIGLTAGVVLVLLPLVFRSVVLALLGFVVSFVPVLCTLGLMAWFGLPVNIATCILGGVVIGIAVDDTIYFLSRVREGMQSGMPVEDAAQRAIRTTGRAMIKTSLILTGGFLTMAASDFMPSVYFGIFFAFSIVVALLADLIVLPVLLRLMVRRQRSTSGTLDAREPSRTRS